MHILIVLPITYVITLYIWGLLVWGVAFAFFFVAAVTLTLLSFVVKFKFLFASGYIAFEIIRFYKPASQAKIFSAACFILFLIHFLLVAISGFDYVWWDELTFSGAWDLLT